MDTSASLLSGGLAPHPSPRPGRGGRERKSTLMIHRMQASKQGAQMVSIQMTVTTLQGSHRQSDGETKTQD